MARKNGKSALGSGIALYGLYGGPQGGEIYSCAGDREQARIVFGMAKRMVELEPDLAEVTKVYRDAIEYPETGSVYRVLSSEAFTKEGLSPTLVMFDEVHVQPNDELWNVMTLGSGARVEPLVIGITTAGSRTDSFGKDSLCYRLYQHGQRVATGEVDDPSFFFAWWEPKQGADADHRSPDVWAEGNPGFGDIVSREDFESTVVKTPESEFRTKRTNVWVTATESAFPFGAWDACKIDREIPADGETVVLGFDGSYAGDSTGLVGCTQDGFLFVIDAWEKPAGDDQWRVDIATVEKATLDACRRWHVLEVACDPYRWQKSMQALQAEGLPMLEWPTGSLARMVPAWQRFYDAVMEKRVSHNGDPRLARHIENMVLKSDARGVRPTKESKMSGRKIDLGICAIVAYDRATQANASELDPWFAFG